MEKKKNIVWPQTNSSSYSLARCVLRYPAELSPVLTCSALMLLYTCKWMRRSPPGSVPSVTKKPLMRVWLLMGEITFTIAEVVRNTNHSQLFCIYWESHLHWVNYALSTCQALHGNTQRLHRCWWNQVSRGWDMVSYETKEGDVESVISMYPKNWL